MKIAMIGQRGLPASFGGIEHHVEEIGSRLAARGHDVWVFCRTNYVQERPVVHRGMVLRHLPTIGTKHLDAIFHSALSTAMTMGRAFDVVHYHALGPGVLAPIPRLFSQSKVVQTIHGRDDQRAKWGPKARAMLTAAAWVSARVPDATVVVSRELERYYLERYGRAATYIANGVAPPRPRPAQEITERFGLRPGRYVLFVGRLVPEKAPDLLIRAFRKLGRDDLHLVIAGGSSFTGDYVDALYREANGSGRVCFTGYVFGDVLDELYSNAAAFVLPSLLEGLPLTLLEAASYGTPIVASNIAPHVEVLGPYDRPGRRLFEAGDVDALAAALGRALAEPTLERRGAQRVQAEVTRSYCWDAATDATEALYRRVLGDVPAITPEPVPVAVSALDLRDRGEEPDDAARPAVRASDLVEVARP